MEAVVGLIEDLLLYLFAAAFLLGLLLRLFTESMRALHWCLGGLSLLFATGIIAGFVLSGGLLIFLLFQLLIFVLVLLFTVFAGAVCATGILRLRQLQGARKTLDAAAAAEQLAVEEFAALEGIEVERALARIRSGYYKGGQHAGRWYVHRSELTPRGDRDA